MRLVSSRVRRAVGLWRSMGMAGVEPIPRKSRIVQLEHGRLGNRAGTGPALNGEGGDMRSTSSYEDGWLYRIVANCAPGQTRLGRVLAWALVFSLVLDIAAPLVTDVASALAAPLHSTSVDPTS